MTQDSFSDAGLVDMLDRVDQRTRDIERSASAFARAMSGAFNQSVTGGRAFDDVLKGLYLRMSDLAVRLAFKPLESSIASGFSSLFSGLFGGADGGSNFAAQMGAIKPFAAGGVIGAPTYFPLPAGGMGLAGEAGPEAILPLARGADGRLGVATSGAGAPPQITVNIATPDAASFRHSDVYITGQIARAVARGQRGL